jgi:uncharacterized protein YyaL (SSP411 family)
VARAIILALEIYGLFGEESALDQAKKWLTFLEYMQDSEGRITNFIESDGRKKSRIPTSYKGGAWWSARAKWAWAKAYKLTREEKYLDLYFKTKILEDYENDVASILLLAGLEVLKEESHEYIKKLTDKIFSARSPEGYLIHGKKIPLHMWGYHELEALAKASETLGEKRLLKVCQDTIEILVAKVVNEGMYFEYYKRAKEKINPYCVSPLVRGLYEVYLSNPKPKHLELIKKCLEWFEPLYDPKTGKCFDWVSNGKISTDCGAEASIEAGFSYLRRLELKL